MLQRFVIRLFDLTFALVALIIGSPFLILIALSIWITDGRPIFFIQKRLGRDGVPFNLIKFRTMRVQPVAKVDDTDKVNSYSIKLRNDPRITPLGAFLRRSSLDELPQLFNIIAGDMSLVGPRPWVPDEYDAFPSDWQAEKRLKVQPGLTGIAQISGRSDLPIEKIITLDLDWINSVSIRNYLTLIFQTAFKVFRPSRRRSGVY
ncbi:sugar transferase [Cochlodiniinecator piscidefendens]|uniref:sugar transferase n=1 Tax=Cochlodiniinecator piscidefendens TaxID=2715756 RepID=UPI0014084944|nr:sugar transferase [Cochlodiniinecator piscidefendens]